MVSQIHQYLHHNKSVGAMIEIQTKTDFALRSECLNTLAKEICLQVASANYVCVGELLKSKYIKDESKSVSDLIVEVEKQIQESIVVSKMIRFQAQ